MSASFTPRLNNGVYRDCKWCGGKGCISCPVEADKEYKRQFPDGPKPIATFERTPEGLAGLSAFIQEMLGGDRDAAGEAKEERSPRRYACRDRMCGALDCVTCHPEFGGEVDIDAQEESGVNENE